MAKIRARARAVDMLGRQQIAGIQNAIIELFKNAHDAYASVARVDYFERSGPAGEGFVVVRDNGVGMTQADFEGKWLVLGTESKTGPSGGQQYRPANFAPRPITGEKGIGRLAIALLGRQVLVLTRAIREDGLHDLVVALVHWGLFEVPGINLDEIDVPVATFGNGALPTAAQVALLREQLLKCIEKISATHTGVDFGAAVEEIENFRPDPVDLDKFFSSRESDTLTLAGNGTGTHFLIGPSNPVIQIDIAAENKAQDYSFRKQILGFCDRTFGSDQGEQIRTSFRRWLPGDLFGEELVDPDTFFTTTELIEKTDHRLEGTVDAFGQFSGQLQVYDTTYDNLTIPWSDANGKATRCGPFKIVFGYLMGRPAESKLAPEEYKALNQKLDYLGGMYVYRDQIRILPYGDHANDWLDVEKRRNKGAGYYFFSFRRMFGAVMLKRDENSELQEKAGREGFQQNEAYRQLREILINLLIQLAAEFFRSGSANSALFEQAQAEMRRRAQALERQQKQSLTKRHNLSKGLATFSNETSTGLPQTAVANLLKLTHARMQAASNIADQDKAASALIRAEQEALGQLNAMRAKYTVRRPTGVALTKDLARDWEAYVAERARLEAEIFTPFEAEIGRTLGTVAQQARIYVDQRKRLEERIRLLADERKRELAKAASQVNVTASDTRRTVFSITEKARLALDSTIRNIQADIGRTDLASLPPDKIDELRKKWEAELSDIEERHRDALMAARDMLASLAENLRTSDGEAPAQIMEALEQRVISLEEQTDEDFEMVQLGLAVAIINHEFAASISRVRRSVQELGQVSRKSSTLRPLYDSIRTNFEHLDGHLNLFTPLQRRLYRSVQQISGKSIRTYVNDLFANRFERHKVRLECTDSFLACTLECYPSTLYPAVINLVDNAVYWLATLPENRVIQLDAAKGAIRISNNGPLIDGRDLHRIFERGFSRKPGGRGLGIFISAQALQAEGMTLSVDTPSSSFNTIFQISAPTLKIAP